jgi:transposase
MTAPADLATLGSTDKDALIQALVAQLADLKERVEQLAAENAALRAENAALRATLTLPPKTPDNSSLPPSRGQKASVLALPKSKRQPHAGAHRPLHPKPTSRRDCFAGQCQHCGSDVSGVTQVVCAAYDRIEMPRIAPDVTRVSLYGGTCPCCARRFKAPPPPGLEPGSPFGPNLRAFVIYLRAVQGIPLERLSQVLRDLFGLAISEGGLIGILSASRDAFAAQAEAIKERLKSGPVLASDETGIRVGKANWWLWVFHHADSAVFVINRRRAKTVVEAFLGEHRPAYWLSDRYGAQMGWAAKEHQVCLAHLIRDVQYARDAGDLVLAPALKGLLKRACAIGRRRPDLADTTLERYAADLDKRLDAVMACTPTAPAGLKLHRLIKKIRRHLFVFVTNRDVAPTNNGSERALRPCAVYRKITNGFRSEWGATLYADIRSVVETARRRMIHAIDAIRFTLQGMPLATPRDLQSRDVSNYQRRPACSEMLKSARNPGRYSVDLC